MKFSSSKIKWITLLVAVFIVGGALGFLSGQVYQRHYFQHRRAHRGNPEQYILHDLRSKLNLTEDQITKIKDILEQQRKRMQKESAPFREKARAIREEVIQQIESVLTPEQKVKYKALREKREEERRQRFGRDTSFRARDTTSKAQDTTSKRGK